MKKEDLLKYQNIIKKREIAKSKSNNLTSPKRKNVCKDIWFSQDENTRLHWKIESDSSTINLTPSNNKFKIVENLENVKCWMQDKLYFFKEDLNEDIPMQETRYFNAKTANYDYNCKQFIADKINFSLFRIKGHSLSNKYNQNEANMLLTGDFDNLSFIISEKSPMFKCIQNEKNND